ncbi:hypothetical protein [Actinoplanes sp. HUAS TT8]|uniref:hypothetical protein n=1 Tax=Actinoplanes sp. HUAS TT8 TaxID=3447453 RepID=UPI003F51E067
MTARTMARFQRAETPHADWCARDHTCGLAEHRGHPIAVRPPTGGRAIVTRVRAGDRDYAEVTLRVPLHRGDALARRQLDTVLTHLHGLFAAVAALRPAAVGSRTARPALDRRPAA